ncbi:integrase [Paenibacillus sp. RC73]|uniref:hypothetical protein n=1 Tax=Paenibacillus sp. RC73 TaxID=3156250 RepID=UPI003838BDE5
MDKRMGRKTISARKPVVDTGLLSYTLEEALDFVVKVKRANNLKERTIDGYIQNMGYFNEWVTERYGDISIDDVTAAMLREYVLWCDNDKEFYAGHPFKADYDKERKGLSPASVNVRICVLKTLFNRNPVANLSLMRQDVDTVMPLTEDELRRFMKAPDQRQWAQWHAILIHNQLRTAIK